MSVEFWRGRFGDRYMNRHAEGEFLPQMSLWSRILFDRSVDSILEVGAGPGLNLVALREMGYEHLDAVEPNAWARSMLAEKDFLVVDGTAEDLPFASDAYDLVFTSGVLIHIPPERLDMALKEIYRVSSRYIVAIEYFSDTPTEIKYRGEAGKLWKRDFGSLWLNTFPDLTTLDCGFLWRPLTGLDNLTYWLFSKSA